jgi:hypothetical protein
VGLFAFAGIARVQDQAAQIETQQDIANRNQPGFQQPLQLQVTDRELGEIDIVSRKPRPRMLTFSTIQSFNYTSNAFLVRNGEQDVFFGMGCSTPPSFPTPPAISHRDLPMNKISAVIIDSRGSISILIVSTLT